MKKTTFKITESLLNLENMILSHMDIPRTTFHRRAMDYFFAQKKVINPRLLITKRDHPDYIKKSATEQIYIDEEREKALKKLAEENDCGITIVLFQLLLDYCCVQAPIILGDVDELYQEKQK